MREYDLSNAHWYKSSYSDHNGGSCLEVSNDLPGAVPVRDSKNPHGPALVFPAARWASFVDAVKDGRIAAG
ncbi:MULTISPECIES: DUF397 domain-containing protein [unclassified Streptomyces]|uniref:DUF397 domain-containing protein n=1 Tax=unclassified Streptomyces TaxID=2593676 RepID=UPI00035DA3C7|nr:MULTISPECIES: DUF397 domain-containing protein [unclassified Streptomyces]MYT32111.1 DUF397 domain-containing protein [Streptomyces sp. SID8354]